VDVLKGSWVGDVVDEYAYVRAAVEHPTQSIKPVLPRYRPPPEC
jgi:hypothetical protein